MSSDYRAYARRDLGVCSVLTPESIGPAGSRFFRLRAEAEHGSALLWLEKEQLHQLAVTIKQMLRTSVRHTGEPPSSGSEEATADVECKVVGLALGHDRSSGRYMLLAQVSQDEGDAIALWADRDTLDRMADRAFEVHDAGRPRCPLCGETMREDKAHVCARAN